VVAPASSGEGRSAPEMAPKFAAVFAAVFAVASDGNADTAAHAITAMRRCVIASLATGGPALPRTQAEVA
jgi:hypothetical protein